MDIGRIQQPKTVNASTVIQVQDGGEATAAGLKLRLRQ